MLRLPRRLAIVLLWAAMALLPMRGLAAALMPMAMAGKDVATATMQHADADADAAAMPCHGGSEPADPSAMPGDCPTCSLCALCHGGVAHVPQVSIALPALSSERPVAAPGPASAPRAPDTLFRPPRTRLA